MKNKEIQISEINNKKGRSENLPVLRIKQACRDGSKVTVRDFDLDTFKLKTIFFLIYIFQCFQCFQ